MSYISERLGIGSGDHVLLLHAPSGYLGTLCPVPDDVTVTGDPEHEPFDVVQVFIQDHDTVESVLNEAVDVATTSNRLWVTVPTSETGVDPDVSVGAVKTSLTHRGWSHSLSFTIDVEWLALQFTLE